MQKSSLSRCHPFLWLPVLMHGWDDSTAAVIGHSFPFTVLSHILWGYWSWGWRVSLAVKTVIAHVQDKAKPAKPANPAPEDPIPSSALCSTPTIYMSTHVCTHKSQVFLTFPYFAKSNGFCWTSCGLISSSFFFLVNVLNHQKSDLKHFYTMKEKRESFDSENIFIYFF